MKFIKYLLLLLFLLGSMPMSETGFLYAESSSEQKKKKKRKKKKKKSSEKEESSSKKKKKKKKRKKKKRSDPASEAEKSDTSKDDPDANKQPAKTNRFNTAAYADELFNLTEIGRASCRERV